METETKEKKDWKQKRLRKEIRTSATQHETFDLCNRKWWLDKVRGLDQGTSQSQAFGTVLHAVCERYLLADDLGRDPDGNPVDLYPKGWHIAQNRYGGVDGELTLREQDTVRRLIAKAIDEGVLERRPNRSIEHPFRRSILVTDDGVNVQIEGFIDVLYPDTVEDHKTSKSVRWLKSKNELRSNTQTMIYGKEIVEQQKKNGTPLPPTAMVTIRHNQFVKDPDKPVVRKTEVQVSVEEIENFWSSRIEENARKMAKIRKTAEVWSDIPDPPDTGKACNAYGGCPFRPICSGRESEAGYEKRLDRASKSPYSTPLTVNGSPATPSKGARVMDLKAKLAQKQNARAAASSTPAVNPPIEAENPAPAPVRSRASAPVETVAVDFGHADDGTALVLPPWVDPDNRVSANGGIGFNSNGEPCKMSDLRARKAGLPTSDMFDIEPMGDGTVMWIGKDGTPAEGLEGRSPLTPTPPAPVKAQDRTEVARPTPAPAPAQAPAPAPAAGEYEDEDDPEDEEDSEDEDDKITSEAKAAAARENGSKGGRPRKGFILVINAVISSGAERKGSGRHAYNLHEILAELGQTMADENGAGSFYALNAFERRDALAAYAPLLVEKFRTDIVYVTGVGTGQSDIKALLDALIPHAGMVINGTVA